MPLLSHYKALFWRTPNCPYYSLPWRPLLGQCNGPFFQGPKLLLLYIALHGGLKLAIITDLYRGPQTTLIIALLGSLYLPIIKDRYRGPQTAYTMALPGGLN
jgi:hypothetical protein